jgi:hypothetical protein
MGGAIQRGIATCGNPAQKQAPSEERQSSEGQRSPSVAGRVPSLTGDRTEVITTLRSDAVVTPLEQDGYENHPERLSRGVSRVGTGTVPGLSLPKNNDATHGSPMKSGGYAPWNSYVPGVGIVGPFGYLKNSTPKRGTHGVHELLSLVPPKYREELADQCGELFPNWSVSASLFEEFKAQILKPDGADTDRFWRGSILRAVRNDAIQLGEKQRKTCGALTWELQKPDGSSQLVRFKCKSERCRHCAKTKTRHEFERLKAQLTADAKGVRGSPMFCTITWDLKKIARRFKCTESEARTLSWGLSRRARARWMELLRGKTREGKRTGRYPGLQYYGRVESHKKEGAHYHFILVCPELSRDMQGKFDSYGEFLDDHRKTWVRNKRRKIEGKRPKRLSFSKVRKRLNDMAIDAGFGHQFNISPIDTSPIDGGGSSIDRVSGYITKVAGELTKTGQTSGQCNGMPVIPRGARMFDTSREFWTVPPPKSTQMKPPPGTVAILHLTSLQTVAEHAKFRGISPVMRGCTCDGNRHNPGDKFCRVGTLDVQTGADMRKGDHPNRDDPSRPDKWPRHVISVGFAVPIREVFIE